jgi:hypothetical protein
MRSYDMLNIAKEVATMQRMTMQELRDRYAEAFGDSTNANNCVGLVRRIAWRLQARAEGDLSERARRRAEELADEADLRLTPPPVPAPAAPEHTVIAILPLRSDGRLPPPGSVITRAYKGVTLQVKVLDDGFEFEGENFKSLSAVARKVTGQHMNGFLFFKLGKEAV